MLGWLGLFERPAALWLAVGSGVAMLVAWGFVYARAEGLGPPARRSPSHQRRFGLAVVALKAFVSH